MTPIEEQLEATQKYAGMLFEFAKEGMQMAGATQQDAHFKLVNYAIMAGLDKDSYAPIVKYGGAYRHSMEEVMRRVGGD